MAKQDIDTLAACSPLDKRKWTGVDADEEGCVVYQPPRHCCGIQRLEALRHRGSETFSSLLSPLHLDTH
ncbi:hypothetical protein INR49_011065, partial [Caranx melampygus]